MGFSLIDGDSGQDTSPGEYSGPMLVFIVGLQSRGQDLGWRARVIIRRWFRCAAQAQAFHLEHAGMIPPAGYRAVLGMTVECDRIPPGNPEIERICESMVND